MDQVERGNSILFSSHEATNVPLDFRGVTAEKGVVSASHREISSHYSVVVHRDKSFLVGLVNYAPPRLRDFSIAKRRRSDASPFVHESRAITTRSWRNTVIENREIQTTVPERPADRKTRGIFGRVSDTQTL